MAIPATGCYFYGMVNEVINVSMISKLDDHILVAAVGQGNALANIFGYGVFLGLSDALVTLSSQAVGAKEFEVCGVYLQRATIVYLCAFVSVIPIFIWSEGFLIGMGQDLECAR